MPRPLQFEFIASIVIHPNGQLLISGADGTHLTFSHSFTTHGPPRGKGAGHTI